MTLASVGVLDPELLLLLVLGGPNLEASGRTMGPSLVRRLFVIPLGPARGVMVTFGVTLPETILGGPLWSDLNDLLSPPH